MPVGAGFELARSRLRASEDRSSGARRGRTRRCGLGSAHRARWYGRPARRWPLRKRSRRQQGSPTWRRPACAASLRDRRPSPRRSQARRYRPRTARAYRPHPRPGLLAGTVLFQLADLAHEFGEPLAGLASPRGRDLRRRGAGAPARRWPRQTHRGAWGAHGRRRPRCGPPRPARASRSATWRSASPTARTASSRSVDASATARAKVSNSRRRMSDESWR